MNSFMNNWLYSDKVKDHFTNPRNMLGDEDPSGFDGQGMVGNVKCGDQMMVVINVDRDSDTIAECKWKTYGCASAIASTSILTELVIGKKLEDAYNISAKEIAEELGGLPEHKVHCSVLGDKGLRAAIEDYYRKNGMEDKIEKKQERLVCQCMGVTDHDIEHAVLEGARTYEQLQEHTKLGTVCGQCKDEAIELLQHYKNYHFS